MTTVSLSIPDIVRVATAVARGYGRPDPAPGDEAATLAALLAEHLETTTVQVEQAATQGADPVPAITPPTITVV